MSDKDNSELSELNKRIEKTLDSERQDAANVRHEKGFRTARENLTHLIDENSFIEYGQLAVAAQRSRRDYEDLQSATAADGIITGICSINKAQVGKENSQAIVIINDYSVLAGTQGFFHHKKLDRMCDLANETKNPVIMFTEGGGGRPADTDVSTQIAGLNITSFTGWARLTGHSLRIAINNGYCFAGNAALYGASDFCIATKTSWIGMAGPAMIEGGGLGVHAPKDIGPADMHYKNGHLDYLAQDEEEATNYAKKLLSYFQGDTNDWTVKDQNLLREMIPNDRRMGFPVRNIIETIADEDSFLELKKVFGRSIITGFLRIEGKPLAVLANDCQQLGGAIDSSAADKAANFIEICNVHELPIISLVDTPGFMVGPDSEKEGAFRRMGELFKHGARIKSPLIGIILRRGYGLGAMAMMGGSFVDPIYTASWPNGEFGGMGLEGYVKLGFKKELEAEETEEKRQALFDKLVAKMYEVGKATEAASYLEMDAVIDPATTRETIIKAFNSVGA